MKVSKKQLRNIIRETVRRKLEMGDRSVADHVSLDIDGPSVTFEQLQRVIDEELELAVTERELDEDGSGDTGRKVKQGAEALMRKKGI